MTTTILPSQIRIASNGAQVVVGVVFPRPNFIMLFLAVLLAWTMIALAVTGLGSLVSLFFISVSLVLNLIALHSEIKKLREQEAQSVYSY